MKSFEKMLIRRVDTKLLQGLVPGKVRELAGKSAFNAVRLPG